MKNKDKTKYTPRDSPGGGRETQLAAISPQGGKKLKMKNCFPKLLGSIWKQ